MDNLLKKLQEEAGLSEDQSVKALKVIKEYMDQENIDIDWNKFFKGKFEDFKDQGQSFFKSFMNKAQQYSSKLGDKVEDIASQAKDKAEDLTHLAKDKAYDLTQKASDYLDKNKKDETNNKE